jgi:hypothetical protein
MEVCGNGLLGKFSLCLPTPWARSWGAAAEGAPGSDVGNMLQGPSFSPFRKTLNLSLKELTGNWGHGRTVGLLCISVHIPIDTTGSPSLCPCMKFSHLAPDERSSILCCVFPLPAGQGNTSIANVSGTKGSHFNSHIHSCQRRVLVTKFLTGLIGPCITNKEKPEMCIQVSKVKFQVAWNS